MSARILVVIICFLASAMSVVYASYTNEHWPLNFGLAMLLIAGIVSLVGELMDERRG